MGKFANFDELFESISEDPRMRVSRNDLKAVISADAESIPMSTRVSLIATRKVHTTLFFEEVIRNKVFTLTELLTLSQSSAPGAVAVIKNINHYSDELSSEDGFKFLRTLLTPMPRASSSVSAVRSKKEIVSALCTREGFFAFSRKADSQVKDLYESIYGETLEDTAVKYVISVYAQELVLSQNDKQVILPRVANSLKRVGEDSDASKSLEFFIHDRFYFRIFNTKEAD